MRDLQEAHIHALSVCLALRWAIISRFLESMLRAY